MSLRNHFPDITRHCQLVPLMAILALFALLNPALAKPARSGFFSLEQRVDCQKTIEDIRWSHRIWPKANAKPKPDRTKVISDEQIRQQVITNLAMEAALEDIYGINIDSHMLQAELDRMARSTRAPERLQEMFSALSNDPVSIAECLARPILVKRKLYNSYAWDQDQHAQLRARAENALSSGNLTTRNQVVQEKLKLLTRKGTKSTQGIHEQDNGLLHVELDDIAFEKALARLGSMQPSPSAETQADTSLRETETAFIHEEILSQSENQLKVRVLEWPKRPFDEWWQSASSNWTGKQPETRFHDLRLPIISASAGNEIQPRLSNALADTWMIPDIPSARWKHTAVWTGSEMIIWGGNDGASSNTGSRYDPAIDSWEAVSIVGAPAKRQDHTAIWTGTEMIIWGGWTWGTFERLNSGGRYNPSTNSWTATSTTGAPSAREEHSAVWTGSEMIVWGGTYSGVNTGGRYNPSTDSWTTTNITGAPAARRLQTAVWTGDRMLIWGGYNGAYLGDGGSYNPATDSWAAINDTGAPGARYLHTAIWSGDEMIIWGGTNGTSLQSGGRYDPATDSWAALNETGAPFGRHSHSAIWTGSKMIIWGGYMYTTSGGIYDPVTDIWTATPGVSLNGRSNHTAVWTGSEMIVWGGYNGRPMDTGARYNPTTNSWTVTAASGAIQGNGNHTAIWTGSEMIVWGGDGFSNYGGRYDPVTSTWAYTKYPFGLEGRRFHTAIWTGSEMIVWGGYDGSSLDTGGRYNPASDSWTYTDTGGAPVARYSHTAV